MTFAEAGQPAGHGRDRLARDAQVDTSRQQPVIVQIQRLDLVIDERGLTVQALRGDDVVTSLAMLNVSLPFPPTRWVTTPVGVLSTVKVSLPSRPSISSDSMWRRSR